MAGSRLLAASLDAALPAARRARLLVLRAGSSPGPAVHVIRALVPWVSWPHPGVGPALEDLDLLGGPGAVAGHRALLKPGEDVGGTGADVVEGPQVEGEAHRLPVTRAEERPDMGREADRLIRPWQRPGRGVRLIGRGGGLRGGRAAGPPVP